MTLTAAAATAAVGISAVLVVGWGAWLSVGSSRHGPEWAHGILRRWRLMPWSVAIIGAFLALLVSPPWAGIGVAYIGVVTGWLARSVRARLDLVRHTYGGFDTSTSAASTLTGRTGTYLLAGSVVIGAFAVWDVTVRGWGGVFGLVLAVCLAAVGLVLRRQS